MGAGYDVGVLGTEEVKNKRNEITRRDNDNQFMRNKFYINLERL